MARTIYDCYRCHRETLNQTKKGKTMTQAQKNTYDRLYKELLNGVAHQHIKRISSNKIKADDAYAEVIRYLAETFA